MRRPVLRGKWRALVSSALVLVLAVGVPLAALADNVQNDVVAGGNDTITAGKSTTVNYRITANNGDGQTGCNAATSTPVTVTVNAPAGVTASPSSLSFTSCGADQPVLFSSSTVGSYDITVGAGGGGGGTFNTNPAKFTLKVNAAPPPTDTTPPVITPTVVGTLGQNNWYTSNVKVTWLVDDGESAVSSSTGCGETNITQDTTGQTLTCEATSAGGTSSNSVTIKRDATAPTISAAITAGTLGSNGWYTSNVIVHFTCDDATSGIPTCPADETLSAEGSAVPSTAQTVKDAAGNTSGPSNVVTVKIDKTKPTITALAAPEPNANGWNKGEVTVSFTCSDGTGSGLAGACPAAQTFTDEGTHTVTAQTVTDTAGNVSEPSNVVTVKIDKTNPLLSGTPTAPPNAEGWYKANVAIAWTCSDALSGIAGDGSCPVTSTISSEGNGLKASATVSDKAGNTTNADSSPLVNIDKTPPTVSVTGVANGAQYTLGSVPAAVCNTTDALSGVKTLATVQVSGGPVGSVTATCSGAQDKAGNGQANPVSVTYSVIYNWTGFFQPVDNLPTINKAKAGSSIPVKFNLGGNQGLNIFASGSPSSVAMTCSGNAPTDEIETVTAGQSSLSYDATANQYVYVWKTESAWAGTGCRQLNVKLNDGKTYSAVFNFTK